MAKIQPFENHTEKYEIWFQNHEIAYQSELRAIKSLLPESGFGLEIGVGSGRFAGPLGIKIGLEPSEKMGKAARKRGISVIEGVAEALPFVSNGFDYAVIVTTICFLDNIVLSLMETNRILRPGGRLVIGFIDRNSPLGKTYQKNKNKNVFYREATFLSVDQVISYLLRARFSNPYFAQTLFHPLSDMNTIELTKNGYGKGSFVVIRAEKS